MRLSRAAWRFPIRRPISPGSSVLPLLSITLWVTQYQEGELYAAGLFPNQGKTVAGLPEFVKDRASLTKQDVAVWYTTGYTHVARPEDFPVMPALLTGAARVLRAQSRPRRRRSEPLGALARLKKEIYASRLL